MSLIPNTRLQDDEMPLSRLLAHLFYNVRDKIRWDRNLKDDCILHSIKNKRTRNTAVIKDLRVTESNGMKSGNIHLTIHSRKKHSAANIYETSIIVVDKVYHSFEDKDMAARIGVHLSEESEYSTSLFERVKMTKKHVSALADDECTGGKIVKMNNVPSVEGPYVELLFENKSGRLLEPMSKILAVTNNPVGSYAVINKAYHIAFYTPDRFHEHFYPVEAEGQVSQPADLFEVGVTRPGALI